MTDPLIKQGLLTPRPVPCPLNCSVILIQSNALTFSMMSLLFASPMEIVSNEVKGNNHRKHSQCFSINTLLFKIVSLNWKVSEYLLRGTEVDMVKFMQHKVDTTSQELQSSVLKWYLVHCMVAHNPWSIFTQITKVGELLCAITFATNSLLLGRTWIAGQHNSRGPQHSYNQIIFKYQSILLNIFINIFFTLSWNEDHSQGHVFTVQLN